MVSTSPSIEMLAMVPPLQRQQARSRWTRISAWLRGESTRTEAPPDLEAVETGQEEETDDRKPDTDATEVTPPSLERQMARSRFTARVTSYFARSTRRISAASAMEGSKRVSIAGGRIAVAQRQTDRVMCGLCVVVVLIFALTVAYTIYEMVTRHLWIF